MSSLVFHQSGGRILNPVGRGHFRKAFISLVLGVVFLSALCSPALPAARASAPSVQTQLTPELQAYQPLSAAEGWILLSARLYYTSDSGAAWADITPSLPDSAVIYSVKFLDASTGMLLWGQPDEQGSLSLQLSRTDDRGLTWQMLTVQVLPASDPASLVESATMDWLNAQSGFISVKQQTGVNFSAGSLFRTTDAGSTWERFTLPIGGPVRFIDPQVGWVAGGPAGDQLFLTFDGGENWQPVPLPSLPADGVYFHLYLPAFDSTGHGLLPAITTQAGAFQLALYSTRDAGNSWTLIHSLDLGDQVSLLPLSVLDPFNLFATLPDGSTIFRIVLGQLDDIANQDSLSAGIVDLSMLSLDTGWAKWVSADCTTSTDSSGVESTSCGTTTRLLSTTDGGLTWQAMLLPGGEPSLEVQNTFAAEPVGRAATVAQGNTRILVGQGIDACTIPTISQLQKWVTSSPYRATNVYIGGIHRACANPLVNTSYLDQLTAQGWSFIPTWVGPQAPCTNFNHKFSYDVNTAYSQGVNEANLAIEALAALGLTYPDKTGSVVYYDLETFAGDSTCTNAAKAFINGWDAALHLRSHIAGVYGSTGCTNGLGNYLTIANVPDVIWTAYWDHSVPNGYYNPSANLYKALCSNLTGVWNNHQRLRQYEGEHNETWGGVTINIDSNVIDSVMAQSYTIGTPSAIFTGTPLSGNSPLTVTFTIANTIYMTACAWSYGDGGTGSSCAQTSTHTYTSPGTYTVSLIAAGPGGTNTFSRSSYVVVSQPPPPTGKPDLIPYPRPSRANPLSLSSVPGTSVNGTLYAGQPTYIDWGFKNAGSVDATSVFSVDLYIDDTRIMNYNFAGIGAGATAGYDDWVVTWFSPGSHTVKLVADPGDTIIESNENNNIYSAVYNWESAVPSGPTTISPTGTITSTHPAYTWNPVANASSYELYVYSLGSGAMMVTATALSPSYVCAASPCTYTPPMGLSSGDYQFKIVVKYSNGTSAFSDWRTFTIGEVPSVPALLAPTGEVESSTPPFSWTKSASASWYDLYVYPFGSTSAVISQLSIPASSSCSTGTCIWAPSMPLYSGNYQYQVRAGNLAGSSDFSPWGTFSLSVPEPETFPIYLPLIIQ